MGATAWSDYPVERSSGPWSITGKPYRRGAGAESIKGMNEHGHFATVHNPVTANRYFPTSMKEINPAEGTKTVHLDITLDPGAKVHLRVVNHQGKPVTGVKTGGLRDRGGHDQEAQAQDEFDVVTLGPGEDRMVWHVHEGRKLGRVIHAREGDDKNGPLTVTLESSATITGRIVDATVTRSRGRSSDPASNPPEITHWVYPRSRLAVTGDSMCPTYRREANILFLPKGGGITRRRIAIKDADVRPGETTDVGDMQLKN